MVPKEAVFSERVVESVFLYIAAISLFLLVLITFLMVYFVIRYRRKKHPHPEQIEGKLWLEILWTVIPTLLVLTMFYYGYTGFQSMKTIPEGALKVKVIARQWSWLFEYENGIKTEVLTVSAGRPVHLVLTSQDVIHSFYIPAFRIKQDAVPGMQSSLWFHPAEAGTYDVLCAEYCGMQHSSMLTRVTVLPEGDFKKWFEGKGEELQREAAKGLSRGPRLFQEKGCRACHSVDGTPGVGPTLKGVSGSTRVVMTGGKEREVVADEAYLRKSILEPNGDVVKGYPPIMPPQKMTDDEMREIVNYIKEIR